MIPMPETKDPYEQWLEQGVSKREIHGALYKTLMHQLACKKKYKQLSPAGKIKWHCKRCFVQVTAPVKSLGKKGLTLLKTQFAKKPKNPV